MWAGTQTPTPPGTQLLLLSAGADWLLNFYASFSGCASLDDITEAALKALSHVSGSFAFVV